MEAGPVLLHDHAGHDVLEWLLQLGEAGQAGEEGHQRGRDLHVTADILTSTSVLRQAAGALLE